MAATLTQLAKTVEKLRVDQFPHTIEVKRRDHVGVENAVRKGQEARTDGVIVSYKIRGGDVILTCRSHQSVSRGKRRRRR